MVTKSVQPYRIPVAGGYGSAKTNALLNLINYQADTDTIFLYAKNLFEVKYQNIMKTC